MKVVLDTNVLVSASLWNGASSIIVDYAEEGMITLVFSPDILIEFSGTIESQELLIKMELKKLKMKRSIEELCSFSELIEPTEKLYVVKEDPDDNKILECAVAGNADFVITYDKQLLKLKEFRGIKIVRPEEFLKKI